MRHPHRLLCGLSGEQHRLGGPHNSPPVLSQAGLVDLSTEGRSHDLESVADAEHGDLRVQDRLVKSRGVVDVHTRGATREDDGQWPLGQDLFGGERVRNHFGVQMRLADPTRDQLCVLRAEVDDQNRTGQSGHAASLG